MQNNLTIHLNNIERGEINKLPLSSLDQYNKLIKNQINTIDIDQADKLITDSIDLNDNLNEITSTLSENLVTFDETELDEELSQLMREPEPEKSSNSSYLTNNSEKHSKYSNTITHDDNSQKKVQIVLAK
ncbi:hypothetical protein TVAG_432300 [Trichomonas vaginalis G3]|uniref:Uncharacterized protein n=1 Tax=Trichomonas vaginalis (strain ATCC PRA-98 / G3) TaxID=412133 RepID=A2F8U4_TRIV3|nr:charged multivesicular body protein family [Trichomonas vaginalis G3]EAX98680.1 hypothetical protein TVAG_432300 [Trichomonas vaginalis G3]KAI5545811.1 charged multivesicular body protein family [Trichomonas vaginalis G3]|eukprot:XP_001311610.1 hypothetical protein [Trichomonas vaginalis G3]